MKLILYLICLIIPIISVGQNLDTLYASSNSIFDFSVQAQEAYQRGEDIFKDVYSMKISYDNLSKQDQDIFDNYDEMREDFWEIGYGGCSWYCGAGGYTVTSSSELKFNKTLSYIPENLTDFNYKTAWTEGVEGYGIGEEIVFSFPPIHPRITTLIIANGYVKSHALWKANSRVRDLKMFVNGKPYAILHLNNVYAEQTILLKSPLGNPLRKGDQNIDKIKEHWKITFEILSVYKGDKYDDTVISEIYFDGIDVHCLAKGTGITMANDTSKPIEDLQIGDKIKSYNLNTNQIEADIIKSLAKPIHKNLVTIYFSDGSQIQCTKDHPFLSKTLEWVSINHRKTEYNYQYNEVLPLTIGINIKTKDGFVEVTKITETKKAQQTYTIVELERNQAFFANGLLTGTEPLKNN